MKPGDRRYLENDSWLKFLDGDNNSYAEQALRRDLAEVRRRAAAMDGDTTTPDTRLADDPAKYNPAQVTALRQLMVAGLDPGRRASVWHTRLRYFDPARRRAGLPDDCAAMIDRMTDSTTRVRLVNTNQLESREVIVQAGSYAEHTILSLIHI